MAFSAVLLSGLLSRLDERVPNEMLNYSRLFFSGSADEMRTAMLNIAGTVLATAGVVFSLLTLPLSTVASQFGSRLIRIFLRDRTTQFVLGIFVGTFSYCLVTAMSIPYDTTLVEAPQITVTFGLFLMLISFASLILLIQHISTMLQAPNIVAAASIELMDVVGMAIADGTSEFQNLSQERVITSLNESEAFPLKANRRGYIQFVDPEIILKLAKDKDLMIRLLHKPGQFISQDETIALVWPASSVSDLLGKHLRRSIQIGNRRTPTQDVEYAINQLVEIAVRAMSPAINDPFTAITCLDYLADGLVSYIRSGDTSPDYYDEDGKLRLYLEPATLTELLGAAFDMLRHASCDNATVLLHMLEAIDLINQEPTSTEARQEMLRHVHLVRAESQAGALVEPDKNLIRLRCELLASKLG